MPLDLTALAQALDSEQGHTSFGKLPLSVEKTAGCYSFPVAKRDDQAKVFIQDLTKTENIGKLGPGPQYAYEDKIKYKEVRPSTQRQRKFEFRNLRFLGTKTCFLSCPQNGAGKAEVRLLRECLVFGRPNPG